MKNLWLFIIIFSFLFQNSKPKFSVDIIDSNYSMASTLKYHITNDSIIVIHVGSLQGEHNESLISAKIDPIRRDSIYTLITSPSFKKLNTKLINPAVRDGDQKFISIRLDGRRKKILISNVYNIEIAKLILLVNHLVDKKLEIQYDKI